MKIKTKQMSIQKVLSLPAPKRTSPKKPNILFRTLVRLLSIPDLLAVRFRYTTHRMDKAGKGPYLILMNHSCFLDPKIAYKILYPLPFNIVATTDSFVGKGWLMRQIGCIPTQKYVTDIRLVMDMLYTLKKEKSSILMYPEAGYSFDGRAVALPKKFGTLIKKLNVPVLSIITDGAFLRDPLYNGLQKRKVRVSAKLSCLLSCEEIQTKSVEEIDDIIKSAFSFDAFAQQYKNQTNITEPFRADGLNRILYRCPHCNKEGQMEGKGTLLICHACGKEYEMDTLGRLSAKAGNTEFAHIPDWYDWQRKTVQKELTDGCYFMELDVDIAVLCDYKALYKVGTGKLIHNENGFVLTGCNGALHYTQSPSASFSLNADFFWYEMGDVICIGNKERLYYCFPKQKDVVTKARLAAEELYKLKIAEKAQ